MQLDHLNYFIEIVKSGSISAAAEKLHISQPALSRIIKSMEKELAQPLLTRSRKGVMPTEIGKKVFDDYSSFQKIMLSWYSTNNHSHLKGEISILLLTTIATFIMDDILIPFSDLYPSIKISAHEVSLPRSLNVLKSSDANIAIISCPSSKHSETIENIEKLGYQAQYLYSDERVILIGSSSPLSFKQSLSIDDLKQLTLAHMPDSNDYIKRTFSKYFKTNFEVPNLNYAFEKIIQENFAAIINHKMLSYNWYYKSGLLKCYSIPLKNIDTKCDFLIVATDTLSPIDEILFNYILEHFSNSKKSSQH